MRADDRSWLAREWNYRWSQIVEWLTHYGAREREQARTTADLIAARRHATPFNRLFHGLVKPVAQGFVEGAEDFYEAIRHPITTLKGSVQGLYIIITDPAAVGEAAYMKYEDFQNLSETEKNDVIMRLGGKLLFSAVTEKGLATAKDLVKLRLLVPRAAERLVGAGKHRLSFTASESSRAVAAVNEASIAGGLTGKDLVDKVIVRSAGSGFRVEEDGRRLLFISEETLNQPNYGMLLREAAHELVHAQQYAKLLKKFGGNVAAARKEFEMGRQTYRYAVDEVVAETLARRWIQKHLGPFSKSTLEWSDTYLRRWRSLVRARRGMGE